MNILLIGAGNLATALAKEMHRHELHISQIYSRTEESASLLAEQVNCPWTTSLNEIRTDADWYVFAVKDQVLEELICQIEPNDGLWLHTAGSVPASVFEGFTNRYGVLYPLQTFSKRRNVDFSSIPFLLEANNKADEEELKRISGSLTNVVHILNSEERKQAHLAAVFACNFTNHLIDIAWRLLEEKGISPDILTPLIDETVAKAREMTPALAQTGPAIRYDKNVIDKHLLTLKNDDLKAIYRLLSQSIHNANATTNTNDNNENKR